jgi:beta-galactosidase
MGNALTKKEHDEDMELILEVGANSIRLAHYQHDQYFYDLCDEKGIIAWAEIPFITVFMPNGRENTISQMKELISQNYNHASIICWAISNEITLEGVTDELMDNHKVLNDLIHEMDPKRVSAMANLFLLETDSPLVQLPDIRGYNLYYGWYVGEVEDNDEWFDDFHREHPDTVIGLTEYGADSVITKQSPKPVKGDYTESYMSVYHEHMLEMFSTRPYLWGTYVWNMFEFAAAGRDEAGDPGKNHKGLITFDRKQKKDAFYIYKAWWSDEPFIHLCGRRYHDRVEDNTEIKVYSNQKSVTLFIDGKEYGTVEGEHVFKFEVPISGTHTIKAVSGNLTDEMEIAKTSEPNPDYFADPLKVKNWFDEEESEAELDDDYLSVNSTMGEIKASPEGAALLERMMAAQSDKTGMAKGAKIPAAMQKMIERQPLKKLMAQGGMEVSEEMIAQLNAALQKIKKVK